MSVIDNTQRTDSTLKKKLNSICYHAIKESVAMEENLTGNVLSVENLAEIFMKVVPGGENRNHRIGKVFHDLY